ncbi:hypothetical protein C8Q78DRAFT_1042069 [Trametes maxima]|nr:hypothetical protein C8Q78DRAFT_1042069 [Trametes maxima]
MPTRRSVLSTMLCGAGSADPQVRSMKIPLPPPGIIPDHRLQPTRRAQYPPLPDGVESHDRYYFLGWPNDKYREGRVCEYMSQVVPEPRESHNLFYLESFLWLDHLKYPHVPLILARVSEDLSNARAPIWALSCSHPDYYDEDRRPSQAQYDFMVALFGAEAKWYPDTRTKVGWYEVLVRMEWRPCHQCFKTHWLKGPPRNVHRYHPDVQRKQSQAAAGPHGVI